MTKTLTEQWLNGTLKKGNYYVNAKDFYNGDLYKGEIDHFNGEAHWFRFAGVEEVLAPVPSYNEFLVLSDFKKIEKDAIDNLVKIHTEKLEKKLAIAIKALKEMEGVK